MSINNSFQKADWNEFDLLCLNIEKKIWSNFLISRLLSLNLAKIISFKDSFVYIFTCYICIQISIPKAGNNEENLVKMQRHTSSSKNQYEQQRQPPPIPPHPNNSSNQVVGYPFFGSGNGSGGFNSGSSGTAPTIPQQSSGSDSGRARVRRGEHNSECVLYDPAESVVVSF